MPHIHTFRKSERLCLRRDIESLFAAGNRSFSAFPLRVVWRVADGLPSDPPVKVLISVPKRRLHLAVERNRAKRQVREAYRQNKQIVSPPEGKRLHVAFLWLSDKAVDSSLVARKVVSLLNRLNEEVQQP